MRLRIEVASIALFCWVNKHVEKKKRMKVLILLWKMNKMKSGKQSHKSHPNNRVIKASREGKWISKNLKSHYKKKGF